MGSCHPFNDDAPFADKVKTLEDDELLEIWEETQQLAGLLSQQIKAELPLAPEYEQLIVAELQLRHGRRRDAGGMGKKSSFRLKRVTFQTMRPDLSRKKVVFPLTLGRTALSAVPRFPFFQRGNAPAPPRREKAPEASVPGAFFVPVVPGASRAISV